MRRLHGKKMSDYLKKHKYTIDEVADIIEEEGIGYAIQKYLSAKNIADPKLADMWRRARILLAEIERYVDPEGAL